MTTPSVPADYDFGDTVTLPANEVRIVQRHLRNARRLMDEQLNQRWMRGMALAWEHVSEADAVAREWDAGLEEDGVDD